MTHTWLTLPVLALALCCGGASAKEWKELRFGTNPSYPPFESSTADGGVQGRVRDLDQASEMARGHRPLRAADLSM